ncbi:MAG: single-stranded-DNA-specific exonuclease RecJ [Flavobacteriales bacterium]
MSDKQYFRSTNYHPLLDSHQIKTWNYIPEPSAEEVDRLSQELQTPRIISSLLLQRGVNTYDKAKAFFRPSLSQLHDPFLMKDMNKAVKKLEQTLKAGQGILIYGDYDVDGTSSVALMYSFLKDYIESNGLSSPVDFHIPDRYTEGYGLSEQGVRLAAENNFKLIITLDCGIKEADKVALGNSLGLEFIICDHHRPGDTLPEAFAILNPKQTDCGYPFKELCGCGVGFKLVQAFCQQNCIQVNVLTPYMQLVAIATAADIVPIVGENRALTHFGLLEINSRPLPGIASLCQEAKKFGKLSVHELVFIIAPRINAAGRISFGKKAVELLLSGSGNSQEMASILAKENEERRTLDKEITEQALEMIRSNEELKNKKSTVLYAPDWHKGVVGIVASRLIETYYKPTIVLTENNGIVSGSARSVKGFDVYNAIEACSHLLDKFGGHMYAAGVNLKAENVEAFKQAFEEIVSKTILPEQTIPRVDIDLKIALDEIIYDKPNELPKIFRIIKQMAPFGPENMRPVFSCTGITAGPYTKSVGEDGKHLRLHIENPIDAGNPFYGIGFGLGEYAEPLKSGAIFDFVFCMEENEFQGNVSLQFSIREIKLR